MELLGLAWTEPCLDDEMTLFGVYGGKGSRVSLHLRSLRIDPEEV